ncbi:hypothetical protein KOR34_36300 [Posidoniimonas corsicana]|uniref:Nitroreductase domain-containing protein n=1 Tax=Posidoniimonas corsicana TaxID=1938618 RepID=A0A5C5V5J1_9BACT|nr:hypothetical protein [Posidoniimonas corsicana]TWT33796.1 hypothetical protein KOR34_36300 [Posidoniimonas corsicana]
MIQEPFRSLIEAAVLAPSGDNTQPWRFDVEPSLARIAVSVDETRDRSPMNAGQRMARIACGAAVENIAQTAAFNGLDCEVTLGSGPNNVAIINIERERVEVLAVPQPIQDRHTNRRLYDGRILSNEEAADLRSSVANEAGVAIEWVTDRQELESLADTIGRADAEMFSQPAMLRAFLDNVRFDRPAMEATESGLPIGSLEASLGDRMLLPYLHLVPNALLTAGVLQRVFFTKARNLVLSASGLAIVRTSREESSDDVLIGRIMQRVWLVLTALGFQSQPMMSIPVLTNARRQGAVRCISVTEEAETIRAVLRFGIAPSASIQAGRMCLV